MRKFNSNSNSNKIKQNTSNWIYSNRFIFHPITRIVITKLFHHHPWVCTSLAISSNLRTHEHVHSHPRHLYCIVWINM